MVDSIKSEFRKLFTARSTYIFIAFCIAITALFAFYIQAYQLKESVTDPNKISTEIRSAAMALGLFISLVGVLLMTHEYRYNTIMYTLTAAKNRSTALLAKFVAVSVFSIGLTLAVCVLAGLLTYAGLQAKGLSMVPQVIDVGDLLWRTAFYGWAYSMFGLIIAIIVRAQVGTIAILFLLPGLGEMLLGLLLKDNARYLPFTALGGVIQDAGLKLASGAAQLSGGTAAAVVTAYIVAGGIIAWLLFAKRDAN